MYARFLNFLSEAINEAIKIEVFREFIKEYTKTKRVGNFKFSRCIVPNSGDASTDKLSHSVYLEGVNELAQDNYSEALNKFKKASSFGHISAKYNLALMTFNGVGDYPDYNLSKQLFIEAKNGGHQRCDFYIDFMNKVDEVMNSGESLERLSSQKEIAFRQIILDPTRNAGLFIYLTSRELIRMINGNQRLAKEFIEDELTSMHLGNEVSIQYVKDLGVYNPNIEVDWSRFENRIHMYMNYTIYPALIRVSNNKLSMPDLVYSKCCVVNEVIKAFPEVLR